ncbi:hypothetical protein KEM48_002820, partial [Puccinia striiformis f. sp. tritici PST-130]
MPSHLRNGRDLSYEQRQRALQYELSPGGAARLQRLGVKPAAAGRRIAILGPGRTATGSRDQPGPDQLQRDVPGSRIEQRNVHDPGVYPVHASTATSGQGTLPAARPSGPEFGADRNSSSPFSAHSDPSTDREDSMDIIVDRPGLDSLIAVLNGQWEINDAESSRPRRDDPAQFELERSGRISDDGRADSTSRRDTKPGPTVGTPRSRLHSGLEPYKHRDPTSTTSAATPAGRVWDKSVYHTPASFVELSGSARSVPDPNGLRIRTSTPLSPSRPRHQPVPAPSSRKLERIREEQEKNQRPPTSSSDSKPASSPALNQSLLPILDNLSDASQRENLLKNINKELVYDNPFLVEDKLHILFQNFLSELSGTLESVPSNLLKSCVDNLSLTINKIVTEVIKSTVIPSLLDTTLQHLKEFESEFHLNHNAMDLNLLSSAVTSKIEDLHDCMLINESQRQADADELKSSFQEHKEDNLRRFNSINDQMSDLNVNEHNRFELINRRLGDICSTLNKVNDKVSSLFEPDDRDPAPHLTHNNPLMNNHQHFSIQEPAIPRQPTPEPAQKVSFAPPMVTHHEMRPAKHSQPPSDDDFPFIKHDSIDTE